MKFYIAGYYGIQCSPKQHWMSKDLLPDKIWSGSCHICLKYPDSWILGWSTTSGEAVNEKERADAREVMKLSVREFLEAQADFNDLFATNQFGFPNVFMNAEVALRKHNQYFAAVPDLKLIGLGLPDTYLEQFFAEWDKDGFEPATQNGVYLKLGQKEIWNGRGLIGYDLLGWDGADYCSFLCGSMESEIHEKHGVQFNEYGLISRYEQADTVSQAIAKGELVAEDGFWAPWLVFEIQTE